MKKTSILLAVLSAIFTLAAAEKNLVINGTFDMKGKSFPPFWMFRSHTPSTVDCFSDGGPNGLGFLRVNGRKSLILIQQNNISLVKDEKYRISAYVRTRNLTGKRNCVAIHPGKAHSGLEFPENQPEWKYIEKIHEGYATGDAFYFSIEVDSPDGQLDIADLKIVPLGAKGIAGSKRQIESVFQQLVPLNLLRYINVNQPELEFFWVGELPGKPEEMRCRFTLNGKKLTVPFSTKKFTVPLKSLAPAAGEAELKLDILAKSGKTLFSQTYPVRFIKHPDSSTPPKRLNNLVSIVYEGKLAAGEKRRFTNPRNNWVLIRYTGKNKPALKLDGKVVLEKDYPHGTTVRCLDMGNYTLENSSKEDCEISIRLVPDMHMFPLWHTRVPGNGSYDWTFAKKYMLPAFTTINVGGIGKEEKPEVERFGLKLLDNASAIKFGTAEELVKRFENNASLKSTHFDGITMDEVEYWSCKVPAPYAKGLRMFKNPGNKEIRTWVIGPPSPSYADFISSVANVSGGHGRLLYEVYNRSHYTEDDAAKYIRQTAQHAALYKDISPKLFNNISVILGNFCLAPMISLNSIPSVDFRYYLDMQMNLIANDPALDGIGGVGYWGTQSCDEETLRWCFALLKHYAVEGNTEMLSKKYGYTFNLDWIKNPDFEEKLDHWQVSGKVEAGYLKNFSQKYEKRYDPGYGQGDTFAIFTKEGSTPAELRQKITGLTPGKLYSVYYMSADYDDVLKEKHNPKRIPLQLTIPGAVITRRSYYIDNRPATSIKVSVNCCKYVFRAKNSEAELVFSNRKAPSGSRQVLNYITVRPYFEP
ncbi:MAG: hypothetical protein E7058_02445 [Lentisphaerae bacterium]|nr:hypothetical protein [Lentisphaerota bacterium]